jgi:hypothetical protein
MVAVVGVDIAIVASWDWIGLDREAEVVGQ